MNARATRPLVAVVHGALDMTRPDEKDTVIQAEAVAAVLGRLGFAVEIMAVGLDLSRLEALARRRPALVLNLVEALGGDGRLGHVVPAVLDHLGVPFTGASAAALLLSSDKLLSKRLLRAAGVATPDWTLDGAAVAAGRYIVKSLWEDASFGIDAKSVVDAGGVASEIAARTARFGGIWFAEAYVDGREFNLSVLDSRDGPIVLPAAEIEFRDFPADRPRIVDYEAKWVEGSFAFANTPRHFPTAPGDRRLLEDLAQLARQSWGLFGLTGYARVDFRVDAAGTPYVLEINANPCLSPDAGFPAAAGEAGIGYDDLVGRIAALVAPEYTLTNR